MKKYLKADSYTRTAALAGILALLAVSPFAYQSLNDTRYPATARFPGTDAPELRLEIADTPEEREKGLMHRRNLEKNTGMLFIFPGEKERTFWMKNTYLRLDIIFIAENGTIVKIHEADPQPDTAENQLKRYRSGRQAKYVIEVKQDFTDTHGIKEGGEVSIEKPSS